MSHAKTIGAILLALGIGALTPYLARTAEVKPVELPTLKVAYLDMGMIFTNTQSYKSAIETMKQQTEVVETQFKAEYEDMQNLNKVLAGFPPESDDFKLAEAEIGSKEIAFKLRQAEARKDFEARINDVQFKFYQQIEQVSRKLCAQHGIGILLRHNTSPVEGKDPQQVLRAINQVIVVADPRLDLTAQVLVRLAAEPLELLPE